MPLCHDCIVFMATGVLRQAHVRLHVSSIQKIHTELKLPLKPQAWEEQSELRKHMECSNYNKTG